MERITKVNSLWVVAAAVIGGVLGGLISGEALGKTCAAWGRWLRELSLAGGGRNVIAWAVVIVVSLLPALGLLWRGRKKTDWLLLLAGGELFAGQYFLVNPALLSPHGTGARMVAGIDFDPAFLAQFWGMAALVCVLGTLSAWALLRLMNTLETGRILLPKLLRAAAVVYGLLLGMGMIAELVKEIAHVSAANTQTGRVTTSALLLVIVALLELAPSLMACWLLLWGGDLAAVLEGDPFGEATVALAEEITRRCVLIVRLSLLLSVGVNLLQLAVFSRTASIDITVYLPLPTLVLAAALGLLCRYFRRAKAVSDDNATII